MYVSPEIPFQRSAYTMHNRNSGIMKTSIFLTLASITALSAQTPPPGPAAGAKSETATPAPPAVETTSRTKHEITVNGTKIPYTATAGTLVLKKEDGKPWASMFYVAYTRDDTPDPSVLVCTVAETRVPPHSWPVAVSKPSEVMVNI